MNEQLAGLLEEPLLKSIRDDYITGVIGLKEAVYVYRWLGTLTLDDIALLLAGAKKD